MEQKGDFDSNEFDSPDPNDTDDSIVIGNLTPLEQPPYNRLYGYRIFFPKWRNLQRTQGELAKLSELDGEIKDLEELYVSARDRDEEDEQEVEELRKKLRKIRREVGETRIREYQRSSSS